MIAQAVSTKLSILFIYLFIHFFCIYFPHTVSAPGNWEGKINFFFFSVLFWQQKALSGGRVYSLI